MKNNVLAGALVALGLSLAGLFVYCGISKFADKDRAVTVKGLSTREVEADYVVWPLSFGWNGNDLPSLYQQIGNVSEKVKKHLLALGFEESDLRQGPISVDNNWENYYWSLLPKARKRTCSRKASSFLPTSGISTTSTTVCPNSSRL